MKRITLSAEASLIHRARQRAAAENTTLNDLFRTWIGRYVAQDAAADQFVALMARLEHVEAGGRFSRDEMNARN